MSALHFIAEWVLIVVGGLLVLVIMAGALYLVTLAADGRRGEP